MKTEFNKHHINLLIINEIMVILSDEYNQVCFYDIMIYSHHTEGVQQNFSHVYLNHTVYIPLQYLLFFPYNDSDWT